MKFEIDYAINTVLDAALFSAYIFCPLLCQTFLRRATCDLCKLSYLELYVDYDENLD